MITKSHWNLPMSSPPCKICTAETSIIEDPQFQINYNECPLCSFISTDQKPPMTAKEEKTHYLQHDNNFGSEGYVKMFRDFINDGIAPFDHGIKTALDFGCGHGPVLAELLRQRGYETDIYDKYFASDKVFEGKKYDLITATEVLEHLNDPMPTIELLVNHLNKDGILAVMTAFHPEDTKVFQDWWYRRDDTHISFYSPETFRYIAETFNMKILKMDQKNLCVMRK